MTVGHFYSVGFGILLDRRLHIWGGTSTLRLEEIDLGS